jgi:phosphate transport system substrate-binding protein
MTEAGPDPADPLRLHASEPWPWLDEAVGLWNANADPDGDKLVWQRLGLAPAFDARVADRFAAAVGLSPTGERATPPFRIALETASTPDVAAAMVDDRVDLWATEVARSASHVPDDHADGAVVPDDRGDFREHVYGHTGYRFVVGASVAEAKITSLPLDRLVAILEGEVTNWRAVGGPDREIGVVGPATGTPPGPFERFRYEHGIGIGGLDARAGVSADVVRLVSDRDGIGVVGTDVGDLATVDGVAPLALRIDGRRYDVYDAGHPMTFAKPLWSFEAPDPHERAVVRLFRSPFGQRLVGRHMLPAFPDGVGSA